MNPIAQRRPTIRDVALLAGVSHQTVSRYFSDNAGLKTTTRTKVDRAVAELDYRPSEMARSMRTRRSKRLAVVMPGSTDFLPIPLLAAAAAEAHEAGFQLEIVGLEGGAEARADRMRELAESGRVEGVLSLAPVDDSTVVARYSGSAPIIVLPAYDDAMRGLGELADADAAREIIEYLAGLGHRRFLHVAGLQTFASARNRRTVYEDSIRRLGLESHGIVDGDWSGRSGYDAVMAMPQDAGVTAVFAANDLVAAGVVRGARERGLRIPDQLSVFGWDDDRFSSYLTPSLSTVNVDRQAQGRSAIRRLLAAIAGDDLPPEKHRLNRLVIRESTGPAPE